MRCGIKFKEISLYLDGKYGKRKREALKAHIADCPRCSKYMDTLKGLRASLTRLAPFEEPSSFDFEFNRLLEQRLREQQERSLAARVRGIVSGFRNSVIAPVPATVRVAASFLLLISLTWGIRAQILQKMPFVEFSTGDVRVYRQADGDWTPAEPDMRLRSGDRLRLEKGALINIVSKGRYKVRAKDKSLIVLSRLESGFKNVDAGFSLSYGNLLVKTTDRFRGSKMNIYTPACDAEVVGTAFIVDVSDNNTWLGVLEGKVRILPKIHPLEEEYKEAVPTYVCAGQKALTKPYSYSTVPELLSDKEWKSMLELYQLVEKPRIMLLIGTGSNRVDELLGKPAPVYIPSSLKRIIPDKLLECIYSVKQAAEEGDTALISSRSLNLQKVLAEYPNPAYNVEILMFIASHLHYADDYESALKVLEEVTTRFPDSELASLAQCGIASIYQDDLQDINKANSAYDRLIKAYPASADAIRAKEILSSQR